MYSVLPASDCRVYMLRFGSFPCLVPTLMFYFTAFIDLLIYLFSSFYVFHVLFILKKKKKKSGSMFVACVCECVSVCGQKRVWVWRTQAPDRSPRPLIQVREHV
ncbi:hypothetical protein M441DRAFT_331739 [Trichoderma asperellum CBS 433.97]|uniref:Uncharacterized protein n=1 Tax=Trichoderma asperellum (strain ATCC 204424 / CBS 433.97 / NBRC 101777) TaxID=1042311 RepID=A0A2T3YRU6_TRIA4|nr:hypothetical protein M441DRAFT_331739 [Trichoderma asperellum CBS 433.97]PTB35282.1 hypothetical protein M441DRAFT_331739 [Trichoderma asperellum CBS 433.97]